jgi:hypothetical protein
MSSNGTHIGQGFYLWKEVGEDATDVWMEHEEDEVMPKLYDLTDEEVKELEERLAVLMGRTDEQAEKHLTEMMGDIFDSYKTP